MCDVCKSAKVSIEGLELRLLDTEQRLRGEADPLLRETKNELKAQLVRAGEALHRLKYTLHGTPLPTPPTRVKKVDEEEGQGVLAL